MTLMLLLTVVLLMNLLIAMLTTTYEDIRALSEKKYKHLSVHRIVTSVKRPLIPAPLSVLSAPYYTWFGADGSSRLSTAAARLCSACRGAESYVPQA